MDKEPDAARPLDFIVIGAQKAGTTALFEYLNTHPAIYMPPEKEAPFFSDEEKWARGWAWYVAEYFGEAPKEKIWGKATPHYMLDAAVPERIKATLPDAKLIAILRDPVQRAYSAYRMAVQRKLESRTFEEAIEHLLAPDQLEKARLRGGHTNSYVAGGEYGRIFSRYLDFFPREQLLVLLADNLNRQPQQTVAEVFRFLGVDATFVPPNLGQRYREGASRRLIPGLQYRSLKKSRALGVLRPLWRGLFSQAARRRFWYWLDLRNVARGWSKANGVSPEIVARLRAHYAPDSELLMEILGQPVPWVEQGG